MRIEKQREEAQKRMRALDIQEQIITQSMYVLNETAPNLLEFGEIMFQNRYGGLSKQ
ncbi:hypothetical protein D929_00022 [Enterococcus faecalis 02-MB-P-10]|uniref:hypothetical protein n=1 Tax=Enterococcus faecalis TaxID=1351 RepID=UPI0003548CFE|nr:hypothetical protein [Enterococcus faecalis]EPH77765.1 hypothetical protein D929_00022 [Enterococcus faecalis 02-MB-P-10]